MSFSDIIGHGEAIEFLKRSVESGRVSPSYLFTGEDSIGKKTVALNFAKFINCLSDDGRPCDRCVSCRKIDALNSPDITLVIPSGKGKVVTIDKMRDIKREANLKPFESRYKVFIIDDAEALTQEASNSLLKILEESPGNNVFIMVTSMPQWILDTIKSRSIMVKFRTCSVSDLRDLLIQRHKIEDSLAHFMAQYSGGRIGKALIMKDGDTYERKNGFIDMVQGFLAGKPGSIDYSSWEYDDRFRLKEDLSFLLSWFRDIYIAKIKKGSDLIFNCDRAEEIMRISGRYSFDELGKVIDKLILLESYIDMNVNIKIIVDVLLCALDNLRQGKTYARIS